MKNIKLFMLMLLIGGMSLTSCESYFGNINVDPDNPVTVTPNVLLPQIQVRLAYTVWGDASRFVGIYNQHVDGIGRQFAVIQNYGIQPSDLDAMWGQNIYSSILMDNRQLRSLSEASNYGHYTGISKAIEAYTMMMITDLFGDVPYSEAFQGTELIQPKFDSQESVYNAIFALITEAKADFAGSNGGFAPGADDLIYGGDIASWTKFLNTLEARGKLHLAKRNGATAYTDALAALAGGFTSADDDARIKFGSGATEAAPWYQYIDQRDDIETSTRFRTRLQALNDPRISTYGGDLELPHPIFVPNQSVSLLDFTEAAFIKAECEFNANGGAAAAHQAYLDGISASFDETGQSADYATYVGQSSVDPGSGNLTLEHIMTQKHIALFGNYEAFSDWRRTGFPNLTATPNTGNEVPRRLPYALTEILSNSNTPSPATVTIYSRVWWDN